MTRLGLIFTGCVGYMILLTSPVKGEDNMVFTAVKTEKLFQALGLSDKSEIPHFPGQFLRVKWSNHDTELLVLNVSVHVTVEEATAWHDEFQFKISVGPRLDGAGVALGDRHFVFGEGESGTICFRRRNVVVWMGWLGDEQEALSLAQSKDALIRDDREIAPLGTFDPAPAIVDVGLPATLAVPTMTRTLPDGKPDLLDRQTLAFLRINPVFQGLGPVEKIRLHVSVEDFGRNEVGLDGRSLKLLNAPIEGNRYKVVEASAQNDGRFILRLGVPEQPTTRKVTLIAASEDNVIVTKEADITFTPQP
jgi:hypothetical protein